MSGIDITDFVREVNRAMKKAGIPKNARLWWFCPQCGSDADPSSWHVLVAGSPLFDEDGVARCPHDSVPLEYVSDESLKRFA